jgi:Rrf2 family protein
LVFQYLNMSKLFSLSEASSIAIHAMVLVAKSEGSINVNTIAETTHTSRHHVAKVMQRLAKGDFISSTRGPSGGFVLKKESEGITFLDIYEAIEGKVEIAHCMFESTVCPFGQCIMNNITSRISKEFIDYLRSQTLANYL